MTRRSGVTTGILVVLFMLANGYVFPDAAARIAARAGMPSFLPLDLTPLYSPGDAHALLAALGPDGRRLYLVVELTVDLAYPLVYGALFWLLVRWLLARSAPPPRWLARAPAVPIAAAALDFLENAFIVALLAVFPARASALAVAASATTTVKLALFALSLLLPLLLGVRWLLIRRARAPA